MISSFSSFMAFMNFWLFYLKDLIESRPFSVSMLFSDTTYLLAFSGTSWISINIGIDSYFCSAIDSVLNCQFSSASVSAMSIFLIVSLIKAKTSNATRSETLNCLTFSEYPHFYTPLICLSTSSSFFSYTHSLPWPLCVLGFFSTAWSIPNSAFISHFSFITASIYCLQTASNSYLLIFLPFIHLCPRMSAMVGLDDGSLASTASIRFL